MQKGPQDKAKLTVHPQKLTYRTCLKAEVEATTAALGKKPQVNPKWRLLRHLLSHVFLAYFLAFVPPVFIYKADMAQLPC